MSNEVIETLPPNRQNAASEGEERKRSVATTRRLSDEAIVPRRDGGWDESFAILSLIYTLSWICLVSPKNPYKTERKSRFFGVFSANPFESPKISTILFNVFFPDVVPVAQFG